MVSDWLPCYDRSNRLSWGTVGRLLLFVQVDQGENGTDQQTDLDGQFCDLIDRIPSHHGYPLLSCGGEYVQKKLPLLNEKQGSEPQIPLAETALYRGDIVT